MNLNQHSFLASFYRYAYQTANVPKGFCDYFWNLVLAFIALPLIWLPILINVLGKKITVYESMQYCDDIEDFKLVKRYNVSYSITKNSNSILFAMGLILIGLITLSVTHSQLLLGDTKGLSVLFKLYGIGSAIVFVGILVFRMLYILVMYVYDEMKDKLDEAELRLKRIKKIRKQRLKDEKYWKNYEYRQLHPSFFKLTLIAFKSKKEKHCPKINWVD